MANMLRYDFRFWDKVNKQMLYGVGISPNQRPIIKREDDGTLEELQGSFVPMINTGQRAMNGTIFEADVCECDVPALVENGVVVSWIKARGVMQYNHSKGCFTLNIVADPNMAGAEFQVVNSRIIGCAIANPELLTVNPILL